MRYIYTFCLSAILFVFTNLTAEAEPMKLSSPSFTHEGTVPAKFTCDGNDTSPELIWEDAPAATKSFVLIVDDPDAPHGTWVHWVVYNIPASVTKLPEGTTDFPKLGTQGTSSFNKKDYGGPCPPSGTHRYYFKLYALDDILKLPEGASLKDVEAAMVKHKIAEATLMGRYQRH
jgi:Raf kinase inhibitor-like YbhB/YbcL family protein